MEARGESRGVLGAAVMAWAGRSRIAAQRQLSLSQTSLPMERVRCRRQQALPFSPALCTAYPPGQAVFLISQVDVDALISAWARGEPTFCEDFEPAHGNSGHATASELAVELTYVEDNDDGVVYSGPELNAAVVGAARETMLQSQREAGAAHGVSRRLVEQVAEAWAQAEASASA